MGTEGREEKYNTWKKNTSMVLHHIPSFCIGFASLKWLEGIINFIFRFVATSSELLLAIGVIVSAADFLNDGKLMHNNPSLALAWAWTQAIAIESSSGVVFVYAFRSFEEEDKVKAWLYIALGIMLALVGGIMLLVQIIYNTTGVNWVVTGSFLFILAVAFARVIVSIAYIIMGRLKHTRFSGKAITTVAVPTMEDITLQIQQVVAMAIEPIQLQVADALQQLQEGQQQQIAMVIQEVKRTVVTVVEEQVTQTQQKLLAIPKQPDRVVVSTTVQPDEKITLIQQALVKNPSMKDQEVAELLGGVSINTARKWKSRAVASK